MTPVFKVRSLKVLQLSIFISKVLLSSFLSAKEKYIYLFLNYFIDHKDTTKN